MLLEARCLASWAELCFWSHKFVVAASAWEDVGAEDRSVANSCPADGCKVMSNVLASSQDSTNKLDLFGLLSLHRGVCPAPCPQCTCVPVDWITQCQVLQVIPWCPQNGCKTMAACEVS